MIVDIQLIQSNSRGTIASYYMMTTHHVVVPSYTTTTTTTTTTRTTSVNDTGEGEEEEEEEEEEGEPTVATSSNSSSEFHHHQIDSHDHHFPTLLQHQHDRIFFVHVGKAGGSTLSQQLRIRCHWMGNEMHRKQCLREWQQQQQDGDVDKESELSKRIIGHIHATIQDVIWPLTASLTAAATTASTKIVRTRSGDATAVARKHASSSMITSYLFVIRSPVDHIFSWFRFIHPGACWKINQKTLPCEYLRKSQLFQTDNTNKHDTNAHLIQSFATCFPTAQHFLSSLIVIGGACSSIDDDDDDDDENNCHNNGTVVMNHPCHCAQTARAIIQAKTQDVAVMGHSYYNYNASIPKTTKSHASKQAKLFFLLRQHVRKEAFSHSLLWFVSHPCVCFFCNMYTPL
jgi:hypothetical protein